MKQVVAALVLWACLAALAFAQDGRSMPVVGVLLVNMPANAEPITSLFRNALAVLGHADGRNLRLDFRFADGHAERFPALAEALVAEKADVIVTLGDAPTRAAQQATSTIPIVAIADDLVASGLIASMARPGGNTTGVSILAPELDAKKLEILKQIMPAAQRFGLLRDPASSFPARLQAIADAGRALGVTLKTVDAASPADFDKAFVDFRAGGVEAVDILASPMLANFPGELGRLSLEHRLPAICQFREMVATGCLASYGVKRPEMYAMLAAFTDKMLKGARPGGTVARQPAELELVISPKTARKLGIDIPPAILARADEVIE